MMSSQETKTIPRIPCLHKEEDKVIDAINGEIICGNCSTVLGFENSSEVSSESNCSLFHEVEVGCKPVSLECAKRTHEYRSLASYFSNACDKLGLKPFAYRNAWELFKKLYKKASFSKAEIASFALFETCKRFSIPKSSDEIQEAIAMAFSVVRMPTMLRVYCLIEIRAKELEIALTGDNSEYYLNLHLSKTQVNLGNAAFALVKKRARTAFHKMKGNNEAKAKKVIAMAMKGCLLK